MSIGMKAIILVSAGAVAVIGLFVFLVRPLIPALRKPAPDKAPPAQVGPAPTAVTEPAGSAPAPREPTADERRSAALRATVLLFAERYGTFSRAADYANITDLYPLMTARLREESEKFILESRARDSGADVGRAGVTTRALEVAVTSETALSAAASVTTQRTETAVSGASRVYYQTLLMQFVNAGGVWKADSVIWQDLP